MLARQKLSIRLSLRVFLGTLLVAGLSGCGKGADSTASNSNSNPQTAAATTESKSPPARPVDLKHPVVEIETNLGTIKVRLDGEKAPGTVRNFQNYVQEGFYKDVVFHYVLPGKMILGGGYTADYQLKPAASTVRNEAHNGRKNVRGTIAMARDMGLIDSASTQFFINLEDAPQRDHAGESAEQYGFCVFGDVIEGLEVAEKISQSATADLSAKGGDLAQAPKTPAVISAIRVVQ